MQTADERQNKNDEIIYHFPCFPGKTIVKVWHCFVMSHTNPNVESYSVTVSKTRMLQSQINHNKYIRTQELFTRNKYFFKNLCYQTEKFNIKRN